MLLSNALIIISLVENEPYDFLQKNVMLTVPFLLHQMLFLVSRITVFIQEITILAGALSGLRQFLVTKSPLKLMKNSFYSTVKVLFFSI